MIVNKKKILLDPASPPQFSIIKKGWYEPLTSKLVLSSLSNEGVFFDVGANFGYFSVLASHRVGPAGSVLSFEPSKDAFVDLISNCNRNHAYNIFPFQVAISDTIGARVNIEKKWYRQSTGGYIKSGEGVFTATLDYFYLHFSKPKVKLIKIDTEGSEFLVLKGAKKILTEQKPLVIVEVSNYSRRFGLKPEDIYGFMSSFGYEGFALNDEMMQFTKIKNSLGQILFKPK